MRAVHSLWAHDENGEVTWTYAGSAGRSSATFALLAGVGIAFVTRRRRVERGERQAAAASLAARAGVIGAVGLLLGGTDAGLATVILAYYAVLFVLAIPAVFLSTRTLIAVGATIAVVVPVFSHLVRPHLPDPADGNVSLAQLFQDPLGLLTQLTLTGRFPALPWMAYVCIGIVVGRMELSVHDVAVRLFAVGSTLAVGARVLSSFLLGTLGGREQLYGSALGNGRSRTDVDNVLIFGGEGGTPTDTWWWLATAAPHTTTSLDLVAHDRRRDGTTRGLPAGRPAVRRCAHADRGGREHDPDPLHGTRALPQLAVGRLRGHHRSPPPARRRHRVRRRLESLCRSWPSRSSCGRCSAGGTARRRAAPAVLGGP